MTFTHIGRRIMISLCLKNRNNELTELWWKGIKNNEN